jgi:hypothetical protein
LFTPQKKFKYVILIATSVAVIISDWFQGLIDAHEQFKQTLPEADKEYNSIIALVQEVQRISQQYGIMGGMDNPYISITAQVRACALPAFRMHLMLFY